MIKFAIMDNSSTDTNRTDIMTPKKHLCIHRQTTTTTMQAYTVRTTKMTTLR